MSRNFRKGALWSLALTAAAGLVVAAATVRQQADGVQSSSTPPVSASIGDPAPAAKARVAAGYGSIPLHFEVNRGQTDPQVQYFARGAGYSLFLTADEAVMSLHGQTTAAPATVLRTRLVGVNKTASVEGQELLPGKSNYFIGGDRSKWRTGVEQYARVHYDDVYPGIDLVYYGNQRKLEYDFVVAPGANPDHIRMAYQGADQISVNERGDLLIATPAGVVVQHKPVVYQQINGRRVDVAGRYLIPEAVQGDAAPLEVAFALSDYDTTQTLVIDPVLEYSTYLGGSGTEIALAIAADAAGNAYICGFTDSPDFPIAEGSPIQPALADGGAGDGFIAKIDPAGTALLYSTYLGGTGQDSCTGIAVDSSGNVHVAGATDSTDFPGASESAIQPTFGGGGSDNFVAKINASGSVLLWSTYLGGSSEEAGGDITTGVGLTDLAIDSAGNVYVTGVTLSTDFTTVGDVVQPVFGGGSDAFVVKINSIGSDILYSTYLGGASGDNGIAIAVDAGNNAYVAGITASVDFPTSLGSFQPDFGGGATDTFIAKINPDGSLLVYSTYLGRTGYEIGFGIAVDSAGNAIVAGQSVSGDLPTTLDAFQPFYGGGGSDGFVTKLNAAGSDLIWSTYLGGSGEEALIGSIALDGSGNVYVAGGSAASDFPLADAIQGFGGSADAVVAELSADGSTLLFSTYLGSSEFEIAYAGVALDSAGNLYSAGFQQVDEEEVPVKALAPRALLSRTLLSKAVVPKVVVDYFPGVESSPIQASYGGGESDGIAFKITALPPTVSISDDPDPIELGESTLLSWSSTNATSCTASSNWSGAKATSGSESVTPPTTGIYTYVLTCNGPGGSANDTAVLTVNAGSGQLFIDVDPSSVRVGDNATVTWSSNLDSCVASGAWSGNKPPNGSEVVTPDFPGTRTYTLTCTGDTEEKSAKAISTASTSLHVFLDTNEVPGAFKVDDGALSLGWLFAAFGAVGLRRRLSAKRSGAGKGS